MSITRRTALFMLAAPAIVRATSLMPVKALLTTNERLTALGDALYDHTYMWRAYAVEFAADPKISRRLAAMIEKRQAMMIDELTRLMYNDVPPRADRGSQPFGLRRLTT